MYLNKNLDEIYLDIIDKKISELGFEICSYRNEYLNKINNYISNKMKKFKENSSLFIKYNCLLSLPHFWEEYFLGLDYILQKNIIE